MFFMLFLLFVLLFVLFCPVFVLWFCFVLFECVVANKTHNFKQQTGVDFGRYSHWRWFSHLCFGRCVFHCSLFVFCVLCFHLCCVSCFCLFSQLFCFVVFSGINSAQSGSTGFPKAVIAGLFCLFSVLFVCLLCLVVGYSCVVVFLCVVFVCSFLFECRFLYGCWWYGVVGCVTHLRFACGLSLFCFCRSFVCLVLFVCLFNVFVCSFNEHKTHSAWLA